MKTILINSTCLALMLAGTSDNSPKPGICCRPTLQVGEILNKTAASQKRPTTLAIGNGVTGGTLALAGCQTPEGNTDRTATGALTGGVLGAGTGAIIGAATGDAGAGAAIGGILGAVTGGVVGHAMDAQQRDTLARQNPQTLQRIDQGQPLGLADIKAMSKAGIGDEVIISQIRNSRVVYRLTTAEIIDLKDSGVSQKVIDFMINTPSLYPSSR